MFGLRSVKSRVRLMPLLPFFFMVVASPLTHTCTDSQTVQSASSTVRTSRGHSVEAFATTASAPSRGRDSCAACMWVQSTSTLSPPICALSSIALVTEFIRYHHEHRVAGIFQPHAPRAPPVG